MEKETFTFHFETHLPVPLEETFAWFEKPGAFERLMPPFTPMKMLSKTSSFEEGSRFHFKWVLFKEMACECIHQITHLKKNDLFIQEQIKGPFTFFKQTHKFRKEGENHTVIEAIIEYGLLLESFLGLLAHSRITKKLSQIFRYRQEILKRDLLFLRKVPQKKLKILITGSHGLVGQALIPLLQTMGHTLTPIQRQVDAAEEGIFWDIENQKVNPEDFENHDAVIHLAGENVAQRWTESHKEKIYKSRIDSTHLLVQTLNKLKNPPRTFIGASGVHYYEMGKKATEESPPGKGFLFQVIEDWEKETQALERMRVAHIRTGIVLSPKGGMLKKLMIAYKAGLGMKIGDGNQMMSWISIEDLVYLYAYVLMTDSLEGPINAVAPYPVNQDTFSKTLAKVLHRPRFLTLPSQFLKALTGEMGEELILSDLNVTSQKLLDHKYPFQYPKLESCLKHLLGVL